MLVLVAYEPVAEACSGPICVAGILPRDGAVVPANLPALLWDPTYGKASSQPEVPTTTTARILDLTAGTTVPHLTEATRRGLLVRPTAALVPGHQYAFEAQDCFTGMDLFRPVPFERTTFTATRAYALPTAIGALRIVKQEMRQLWVPFTIFECRPDQPPRFDAMTAEVELVYSVDAVPFEALSFLQLRVDGRRVPQLHDGAYIQVDQHLGQGYRAPRGKDLVILVCETGRERQTFSVTMEAELPGVGVFETPPIEVELECGGSDGGTIDAGPAEPPMDAGSPDSSALEALTADPGCGCRTSGPVHQPVGWWCWTILGSALLRRRLRRPTGWSAADRPEGAGEGVARSGGAFDLLPLDQHL